MRNLKRVLLTILGCIICTAGALVLMQASDLNPLLYFEKWNRFLYSCYAFFNFNPLGTLLIMGCWLFLGCLIMAIGGAIIKMQGWFAPQKSLDDFSVDEQLVVVYKGFWQGYVFQKLADYKEDTPFKEMKNVFRLKEVWSGSSRQIGEIITITQKEKKYRSFSSSAQPA